MGGTKRVGATNVMANERGRVGAACDRVEVAASGVAVAGRRRSGVMVGTGDERTD